jgi:ATP-dependent DNA helicase DinG
MKEIFSEDGILKNIYNRFEFRSEQLRMSEFILDTLADRKNGLIEAGTGVGKTLAYLIPSILYCLENKKRLAVSTETKALQKQLIDKEIPAARRALDLYCGSEFTFSLCLGSSNYPCRRRFEMLLSEGRFRKNEMPQIERLRERFAEGVVFTKFDVTVSSPLWERTAREADTCSTYRCPFAAACVFQKARKEWAQSDILILNHYLFYANIAAGKTYLPPIDVVVFDEAHSLEEIAAEQLGFAVSQVQLTEILARFHRKNKRNTLVARITKEALRQKAAAAISALGRPMADFFEGLRNMIPAEKTAARLTQSIKGAEPLLSSLDGFFRLVEEMESEFEDDSSRMEYDIARARLFSFALDLRSSVFLDREEYVYWLERDEDALLGDIKIKGQPVDVAPMLEREIAGAYETSLYVSATLAVGGDFSYLAQRLGIPGFRSLLLQSPFDYKNQVVMFLAGDIEEPSERAYAENAASVSAEIISFLNGNCLMLFTSYRMMEEVRTRLAGRIDLPIFAQGEFPAVEVMERYLRTGNSVLMGTHSFWQGIDLPGDLLRGVIMMRLPFSVPDRPPVQARMEMMESRGLSSFYSYQVPAAVIRFRQGFGRLIRSKTDRGVIAVLDSRIVSRGYGRIFLQSVPECTMVRSIADMKHAYCR